MDLFDMFGVQDVPAPQETKKAKAPKKDAKGKEKGKSSEPAYNCPVTVLTDLGEVTVGEGKLTEKKLTALLADRLHLPADKCCLQKKGKTLLFSVNRLVVAAKGVVEIGPDTKLYVGNRQQVDVSGMLESDKAKPVSFGKLGTYLADTVSPVYAQVVAFPSGEGEVTVVPGAMDVAAVKAELSKMKCSFRIGTPDGVVREIEEDYYETTLKEAGRSFDGKEISLTVEDMTEFISREYPQFKGCASFNACSDKNIVTVFVEAKQKLEKKAAASEDLIPTDATISLIFTKIPLSPEMFEGKDKVKKAEIIKVLGTMYPEYAPERTDIVYDKENKLVIPVLKGARKGCVADFNPVLPYEEWETCKEDSKYRLFRIKKDGLMYQAEITPVSATLAPMEQGGQGEFLWKLPQIPMAFFIGIICFFSWVYRCKGTEALVRVWYHPKDGYTVTVPTQVVTESTVSAELDDQEEVPEGSVLVADIHSHGYYPAFYSGTDDADEKGNRLYGVMGNFQGKNRSFCLRAGTRGYFVPLNYVDIISGDYSEKDRDELLNRLQESSLSRLQKGGFR